jgi:hypothetical protein
MITADEAQGVDVVAGAACGAGVIGPKPRLGYWARAPPVVLGSDQPNGGCCGGQTAGAACPPAGGAMLAGQPKRRPVRLREAET